MTKSCLGIWFLREVNAKLETAADNLTTIRTMSAHLLIRRDLTIDYFSYVYVLFLGVLSPIVLSFSYSSPSHSSCDISYHIVYSL
jgi:hypothetical protein